MSAEYPPTTSTLEWLRKLSEGQAEEIAALHRELAQFRAENKRLWQVLATIAASDLACGEQHSEVARAALGNANNA